MNSLLEGGFETASQVGGAAARFTGVVQKGVTDIVADELNDLSEPEKKHIHFFLFTQKK